MSGLTSPGGFRGDAEGVTEGDAGERVGGTMSGRAPGIATSSSSLAIISGRASSSSDVIGGGAGASTAAGDVRMAACGDEVGLDSAAAAAGIAAAIALKCNGDTGGDFLDTRGDDDTLVLLDEIDDDRDFVRAAARAPARLFGGCAAEGGLVMGKRGV